MQHTRGDHSQISRVYGWRFPGDPSDLAGHWKVGAARRPACVYRGNRWGGCGKIPAHGEVV